MNYLQFTINIPDQYYTYQTRIFACCGYQVDTNTGALTNSVNLANPLIHEDENLYVNH